MNIWMDNYSLLNLLGILIQSIFIQNIILNNFLGMCTYLACSNKLTTANGLGIAVIFVLTMAGILDWFVHQFITAPGALQWLHIFGIDASQINLNFLELIIFISVIAAFVQVLEIVIEKYSPALYQALGSYLPLITVNCAILGAILLSTAKEYPFFPNLVYVFGSGVGWWLAICLIAAIREKLTYSNIPKGLEGMGATFIMTGLMAIAFMGFTGIDIAKPSTGPQVALEAPGESPGPLFQTGESDL